ncbi:MAG: hypothetical protein ACK5LC_02510, partial [Coprobacillaceae bacterium]
MKNNQKGSILQVVLVIFMVLNACLLTISKIVIENRRSFSRIEDLNNARVLEISILHHFKSSARNEILISNNIFIDTNEIVYTVDESDTAYTIYTT